MRTTKLKGSYSPMELTVFEALLKLGTTTSTNLLPKVYPSDQPFNALIVISRAVVTLGIKLEINQENFRIKRIRKPGKHWREITLVKTKTRRLSADYVPKNQLDAIVYEVWCNKHLEPVDRPPLLLKRLDQTALGYIKLVMEDRPSYSRGEAIAYLKGLGGIL